MSSLTFNGGVEQYGSWNEGDAVTIDTTMEEADFSGKQLGVAGARILVAFMARKIFQDKGSLSKLTFCGNGGPRRSEGDVVTIDTTMTEADFSGKQLGVAGAQILAAFMSTKFFEAKGSLSKLIFSGDFADSKPVAVEVGMTEADFSRANLGPTGAMILAAWLTQGTAHDSLRFRTNYVFDLGQGVVVLFNFLWPHSRRRRAHHHQHYHGRS